jgi:hypothetical protein
MENRELLFNLIKKIESGEIIYGISISDDGATNHLLVDKNTSQEVAIWTTTEDAESEDRAVFEYRGELNREFKENFYKEKWLDKCWIKGCPNKIYQTKNDYKKVRIQCQDKHTRMVCLKCAEMNDIENLAKGEEEIE